MQFQLQWNFTSSAVISWNEKVLTTTGFQCTLYFSLQSFDVIIHYVYGMYTVTRRMEKFIKSKCTRHSLSTNAPNINWIETTGQNIATWRVPLLALHSKETVSSSQDLLALEKGAGYRYHINVKNNLFGSKEENGLLLPDPGQLFISVPVDFASCGPMKALSASLSAIITLLNSMTCMHTMPQTENKSGSKQYFKQPY